MNGKIIVTYKILCDADINKKIPVHDFADLLILTEEEKDCDRVKLVNIETMS